MRLEKKLDMSRSDLVELCKALSRKAPELVAVTSNTVETRTRPDKIMAAISAMIARYPDSERATISIG
jgi:DNA invertase Pin-like site-specific DNA recombinase